MSLKFDLQSDFKVNGRLLDRITVTVFRINQAAQRGKLRKVKRVLAKALDAAWMQGIVGADMPGRVKCGPGLRLPHGGRGIAIHPDVVIGSDVAIFPRVMLGRGGPKRSVPQIANGATIYTGAVVVGPVLVGEKARVGANSTVSRDVAPRSTVQGVPAMEVDRATTWAK
ncbi:hypothetical protein [Arthrobacter sp. Marseille-P9274]|uniref:hypothetical protein n=1 Tax=Arthrobacter sp. Marseille-P9274 TaxID=2866572 RepID=UPI0021C60656|nr:hypothetical protein [Arthrobacter sp. Marseille-P9274]